MYPFKGIHELEACDESLDSVIISRNSEEIAHRITALLIVGAKGYGISQDDISVLIQQYALREYFSEDEWLFLDTTPYTPEPYSVSRYYEYKWRMESACILLWAVGYIETDIIMQPNSVCDDATLLTQMKPIDQLIEGITVRHVSEFWEVYRQYQQYEELTRDTRILGREPEGSIATVHPAIVNWRFMGLQWLLGSHGWLQ